MPARFPARRPVLLATAYSAFIALCCGVGTAQPLQPTGSLKGHTDPIYAVAVSPDGRFAATGSFDKTIKLWDPTTGKEVRVLAGKAGHQNQVLSVAFSPNGDQLASGGADNTAKLWDVPSSKPAHTYAAAAGVTRVAGTADGKTLAAGTADGSIQLWTTADGKAGAILKGHTSAVSGLAFAPNGQTLVSTGADRTLRYWNPTNGQPLGAVGASAADITGLAVNPGNGQVITASADGLLKFWPPTPPAAPKLVPPAAAAVTAFALSPDGNLAATGLADKSVRVVNLATAQQTLLIPPLPAEVRVVAVSPNAQAFAAGTADGKLHLFGPDGKTRGSFPAHDGGVTGIAFHPAQPTFLTAGADGAVRLWATPTPPKLVAHPDKVLAAAPLPDGKRFVTGSADKLVRICTAAAIEKPLAGHDAAVTAVAATADTILSADANGGILLWAAATGAKAGALTGPKKPVSALVPQPGARGLAVVYASGEVRFWPDPKAKEPKTLAHPAAVLTAAFTPDGKRLLTVAADGKLRSWALDTGKSDAPVALPGTAVKAAALTADRAKLAVATADGGKGKLVFLPLAANAKPVFEAALPGEPEAVAVSPSAARIAVAMSAKAGRSVRVYDATTGRELQIVAEPAGAVKEVSFLADNRTVAVAGEDKQLGFYDLAVTAAAVADPGGVAGLALHPGTGQVITTGADKTVHVWDPTLQKELKPLGQLAGPGKVLTISRDGAAVAAASGKAVKVWATADGKELPAPKPPADVLALSFSPDRTKLLAGLADNTAWVYDLATGLPMQSAAHAGPVVGAAFHPGQPTFVTASADKTVAVHPFLLTRQASAPAAVGAALAVTPSGSHVLTAGSAKGVAVWNAGSGAKERTLDAETPVTAVAVSKNGQLVAVAHGATPTVTLFNFADGAVIGRFAPGAKVAELAFHPNNLAVAGTLPDNRAVAWSVAFDPGQPPPAEFGKPVQDFPHPAPVKALAFSGDGAFVLTGADDKQARAWRFASDQPSKSLAHPNLVDAVAFDKTGHTLATGCHDGVLRLWDVTKGAVAKEVKAHVTPQPAPIYTVAWTPDGKQVATGSFDKSIKLWDATSGNLVREIKGASDLLPDPKKPAPPEPGHHDQVFSLAFTKDGKYLASGSSDRTVKLWDPATGKLVRDFPNPNLKPPGPGQPTPSHPGFVHCVRFTPDGSRLVSAGTAPRGQGYLAVWSVADGKLIAAAELPVGPIYSFDLTPAGTAILGCGPKARFQTEAEAVIVPLPK